MFDRARFVDTRTETVNVRSRRLPHWTADEAVYFVTFRLADSLPKGFLARVRIERERLQAIGDREILKQRESEWLREAESWLDKGSGACVLGRASNAEIVARALRRGDGDRYDLFAWCVMPNHVHVVLSPYIGSPLESICKSWKGSTARLINKAEGASGRLWQPESFDHMIRSEERFWGTVAYVTDNPPKAGLVDWPWAWGVTRDARR
jgi:REP element-mobilizing transposase RayT